MGRVPKRTNSSANILAARETWSLGAVTHRLSATVLILFTFPPWSERRLADNERDHGGSIASCLFQAFDEFLHFPYFNVLLGLVGLWGAHCKRRPRGSSVESQVIFGSGMLLRVVRVLVRNPYSVVVSK